MLKKTVITPRRFRFAVQAMYTLFYVYIGVEFVHFLAWAMGKTEVYTPKPGAVEGFLPISALLGLRQWISGGGWDQIHPAGLTIFVAIIVMALLFRKGFCGYICPVGFISNLIEKIGRRYNLSRIPVKWVDYPLTGVKYVAIAPFLFTVLFTMSSSSVESFITGPFNMVSDARMLHFFTSPSLLSILIIGALVLFTLIFRNAWCRYLCPYGMLLGLFSWFSFVAVTRDESSCIGCSRCTKGCPAGIRVEDKLAVHTPECIGCAECIGQCPVEGCLSFKAFGRVKLPWYAVGVGAVAVLLAFYVWAKMTGHWEGMPPFMYQKVYPMFLGKG